MNVLVLQSFLAVSIRLQNSISTVLTVFRFNCIQPAVSVTPITCVNSLPVLELYAVLDDDEHCFNLLPSCDGERLSTVCLLPLCTLYDDSVQYYQS